jgi:hypothetical protein
MLRNEDEELGIKAARSVADCSAQESADEISVALVRATASAMSRFLIGDQEATVLNFQRIFDGTRSVNAAPV